MRPECGFESARAPKPESRAPLSSDLRDFPAPHRQRGLPLRWKPRKAAAPLSRILSPLRSFCLRVSGAVAPSAPRHRLARTLKKRGRKTWQGVSRTGVKACRAECASRRTRALTDIIEGGGG